VLGRSSDAYVVVADDPEADPAERRLLAELDFDAAVVAAAADDSGGYLLELYGDGETGELAPATVWLQLLLRVAAGTP
jgi:hypothetical protein